jgi:hypothetical protein
MLRGVVGTEEEEKKTEEERREDELEEDIILEILQEGRGEREEQGERDEWDQHVGWHRKEDVGLKQQQQQQQQQQREQQSRYRHEQDRPTLVDNDGTVKRSDSVIEKTITPKQQHNANGGTNEHDLPRDNNNHGHARDRPPSLRNRRYGTGTVSLSSSSLSQGGVVVWAIIAVAAVFLGWLLLVLLGSIRRNINPSRRRGFGRRTTKGRTL